jgi:uncharacterized membrane protein
MLFVAYSTNNHTHDEHNDSFIEMIMHSTIFSLLMGIIGVLTLIIGIKDYQHHKKCENKKNKHLDE